MGTPTNFQVTGTTVSWDPVASVSSYTVGIYDNANHEVKTVTGISSNSLDLSTESLSLGAFYSVKVTAVGNGTTYSDSPVSAQSDNVFVYQYATVPVGRNPQGIAYGGGYIYVGNVADKTISVIDASSDTVFNTISVGAESPREIAYDGDNRYIFVTTDTNNVIEINPLNGNVITRMGLDSDPTAIAYIDGELYVGKNNQIDVINPSTYAILSTVPVGNVPISIAYGGGYIYVANNGSSTVSVINHTIVTPASVGSFPYGIAYSSGSVYVANSGSDTVSVLNFSDQSIETISLNAGDRPIGIACYGGYVYVTNYGNNSVSVIDASTKTVVAKISVGDSPREITCDGNGNIYVVNETSNTVSIIKLR